MVELWHRSRNRVFLQISQTDSEFGQCNFFASELHNNSQWQITASSRGRLQSFNLITSHIPTVPPHTSKAPTIPHRVSITYDQLHYISFNLAQDNPAFTHWLWCGIKGWGIRKFGENLATLKQLGILHWFHWVHSTLLSHSPQESPEISVPSVRAAGMSRVSEESVLLLVLSFPYLIPCRYLCSCKPWGLFNLELQATITSISRHIPTDLS